MNTGRISENVLKRSVLKQIKTKRKEVLNGAGVGADCAVFSPDGKSRLAANMQESTVNGPGDLGRAVVKSANNLAAAGAEPFAVSLALCLAPDTQEEALRLLMGEAETACGLLGVQIAGGHTAVSTAVNRPVAAVTAYGMLPENRSLYQRCAGPGQYVVISKWIGLEGTALLARGCGEKLLERYPGRLVREAAGFDRYLSIAPEAAAAVKHGVCAMHDASEGGIFAALWELAEGSGVGLTIDLKKLPIRQETVEICEYCGVNPYELLSGGCLVMAVEDGPGLAAALDSQHIPAVVVGRITDSNDRIVTNEEETRYLTRPAADGIYSVFPDYF